MKKKIEITCPYEVYDSEWGEILYEIEMLLMNYRGGDFSSLKAEIMETE